MEKASDIIRSVAGDLPVSKRKLKRVDAIKVVRLKREAGKQDIGFSSRPFVLTGLPSRRLPNDVQEYKQWQGFPHLIGRVFCSGSIA